MAVENNPYEVLANKFLEAGWGEGDGIQAEDLETVGLNYGDYENWLKERKQEESWWELTKWAFKQLTGEKMAPYPYKGWGRNSRWAGEQVSNALLNKAGKV